MTAREAVEQKAVLLDEKNPGWHRKINLSQLEMSSRLDCILGQLYGDFCTGLDAIGLGLEDSTKYLVGFDSMPSRRIDFVILNYEWTSLIKERLAKEAGVKK